MFRSVALPDSPLLSHFQNAVNSERCTLAKQEARTNSKASEATTSHFVFITMRHLRRIVFLSRLIILQHRFLFRFPNCDTGIITESTNAQMGRTRAGFSKLVDTTSLPGQLMLDNLEMNSPFESRVKALNTRDRSKSPVAFLSYSEIDKTKCSFRTARRTRYPYCYLLLMRIIAHHHPVMCPVACVTENIFENRQIRFRHGPVR